MTKLVSVSESPSRNTKINKANADSYGTDTEFLKVSTRLFIFNTMTKPNNPGVRPALVLEIRPLLV